MPHLLFADFLKDSHAYAMARGHWERLWAGIQTAAELEFPWEIHWMRNPAPDGNPIFTAVCRPLRRGVRIIQEEPRDLDDIDLDWWLDDFGDREEPEAIRELVIACCPSAENASAIEELLRQWVSRASTPSGRASF